MSGLRDESTGAVLIDETTGATLVDVSLSPVITSHSLASEIIEAVSTLLNDLGTVRRWTLNELFMWINEGVTRIVARNPLPTAVTAVVKCTPGTMQTIPDDALNLLRVNRNMGSTGGTPGKAITPVKVSTMDLLNPNWHSEPARAGVITSAHDPKSPRIFYVYPPQPSNVDTYIEVLLGMVPAKITSSSETLPIDMKDNGALIDFVMWRCLSKDVEQNINQQRADAYYQSFAQAIGLVAQTTVALGAAPVTAQPSQKAAA